MTARTLAEEMAGMLKNLYHAAGTSHLAPIPMLHVNSRKAERDLVAIGICLAADAMREAMLRCPEGLAALSDFVRQPGLHDVQGK